MKTSSPLAAVVLASFLLTSCFGSPGDTTTQSAREAAIQTPFALEYPYSETVLRSFTENDSFDTIASAGPLYVGNRKSEQPAIAMFDDLKTQAVAELVSSLEITRTKAGEVVKSLESVSSAYVDLIGKVVVVHPKFVKSAKNLLVDPMREQVGYLGDLAQFDSIAVETNQPATRAFLEFQRLTLLASAEEHMNNHAALLAAGLLSLQEALNASEDPALTRLAAEIDTTVPPLFDTLGNSLSQFQSDLEAHGETLKAINSAEYALGMESLAYMERTLPVLKEKLDTMKAGADFSEEDMTFTKELLAFYTSEVKDLRETLQKTPTEELIPSPTPLEASLLFPTAQAEENSYTKRAFDLLSSAGKKTANLAGSAANLGWSAIKTTYQGAKKVTGVTLDTLSAGVQSGKDIVIGVYEKESSAQIISNIKWNFQEVASNYKKGISGSRVLKTAGGYFEGAENTGGALAEGAVEKTLGKGWTSWLAGHVGKITVNMFTGLGKGITKVADTQATTGEIIEGSLDIGLSFIGGSKVLVKGSQAAKGGTEALKLLGKKGLNFVEKLLVKSDLKTLKRVTAELLTKVKLTPEEVKILLSNALEIEAREALEAEMVQMGKRLNQEFLTLLKNAGKTITSNATVEAKAAYKQFAEEAFENSLKGYRDALINVLGKDATEYIDNLIENKASDLLKTMAKDFADKGIVVGFPTAPDLASLAGKWDTGSMTIRDVQVSEAFRNSKDAEGCDFSEVEKQKGKSQTMDLMIEPSSETEGTMHVKLGDDDSRSIPFVYEDGMLKGHFEKQGAVMEVTMEVAETNGKLEAKGPLKVDYMNGAITLDADTGISKTAPAPLPAQ